MTAKLKRKAKAHQRYYTEDKIRRPGITTISGLSDFPPKRQKLIEWANKLGLEGIDVKAFVNELATIGTLGHKLITDNLQQKTTDLSDFTANQVDVAENCALSFWKWEETHHIYPILVETPLVSEIELYGGTLDIYGEVDGEFQLIELKSGGVFEEHYCQVAAQRNLLLENDYPVDQVRIIQIPRAESEAFADIVIPKELLDLYWRIFKDLLRVYYTMKEIKQRRK